jgi:hypothetical protein
MGSPRRQQYSEALEFGHDLISQGVGRNDDQETLDICGDEPRDHGVFASGMTIVAGEASAVVREGRVQRAELRRPQPATYRTPQEGYVIGRNDIRWLVHVPLGINPILADRVDRY